MVFSLKKGSRLTLRLTVGHLTRFVSTKSHTNGIPVFMHYSKNISRYLFLLDNNYKNVYNYFR